MDENSYEMDVEDAKLERGIKAWQERMSTIRVRVAHCHECFDMDPSDPYRPTCSNGHEMQPCTMTKYRVMHLMSALN